MDGLDDETYGELNETHTNRRGNYDINMNHNTQN